MQYNNVAKKNITFITDSVMKSVEESCASETTVTGWTEMNTAKKTEYFVINTNSGGNTGDESAIEKTDDLSGV